MLSEKYSFNLNVFQDLLAIPQMETVDIIQWLNWMDLIQIPDL